MIQAVFLCGGSGTRLWPMSRKVFPKQFAPLLDNKSLLQLTLAHVVQLGGQGAGKVSGTVVLELAPRNTEAAVAPVALSVPPEQLMLFCPANHHIPNAQAFVVMVEQGLAVTGQCAIITFVVVVQLSQHTYSYIQKGQIQPDDSQSVARFIENSTAERTQALILQGDVLRNASIFRCRADALLSAPHQHALDILAHWQQAMAGAATRPSFRSC